MKTFCLLALTVALVVFYRARAGEGCEIPLRGAKIISLTKFREERKVAALDGAAKPAVSLAIENIDQKELRNSLRNIAKKGLQNRTPEDRALLKLAAQQFRGSWNINPVIRYELLTAFLATADLEDEASIDDRSFELVQEWQVSHFEHHFTDPLDKEVKSRLGMEYK